MLGQTASITPTNPSIRSDGTQSFTVTFVAPAVKQTSAFPLTVQWNGAQLAQTMVTINPHQATLKWMVVTGLKYNVYRRTDTVAYAALVKGLAGPPYTDTPISKGVNYYYQVTAVNAQGVESLPSAEVKVVVP